MKTCIAIICIGRTYLQEFERLFKPSIQTYCNKHGYDLKIFTDFLDVTRKHPSYISFQKALIPSHESVKEYDLVVVLDADVYISPNSPPIHTLELDGKIGIVDEYKQLTDEQRLIIQKTEKELHTNYYGTEISDTLFLNTGLMICNPILHGDFLKTVYNTHISEALNNSRGFHYEQSCIGRELIRNKLFLCIPNEWNRIYYFDSIFGVQSASYFIHFAGMKKSQLECSLTTHLSKNRCTRRKY